MELMTYVRIFWQRKWIILITTVVAIGVVFVGTRKLKPYYEAAATVQVHTLGVGDSNWLDFNIAYTERLINTYTLLLLSAPVRDRLYETFELDELPEIEITGLTATELISIRVTGDDPDQVAGIANFLGLVLETQNWKAAIDEDPRIREQVAGWRDELAKAKAEYDAVSASADATELAALTQKIHWLEGVLASLESPTEAAKMAVLQINFIEPASVPRNPAGPNTKTYWMLGAVAGIVGGIVLALLFEVRDDGIHSAEQVETLTGLPVLGQIPLLPVRMKNSLVRDSLESEAFRLLYARLSGGKRAADDNTPLANSPGTLLITSAEPGTGKSTITANLGAAFARFGFRTLLIDADMRHPTLHTLLNVDNSSGLSEFLTGAAMVSDTIHKTAQEKLELMPAGNGVEQPAELLDSLQRKNILPVLKQEYDIILIDAPAVLAVTDALVLAQAVDYVLLVTNRDKSRKSATTAALRELSSVSVPVTGLVLNRVRVDARRRSYFNSEAARR